MRGAVIRLPCDTSGFAPSISSRPVRLRSGIGSSTGAPYSSALAANRLFTSCEPAEYRCGDLSAAMNPFSHSGWL